MTHRAKRRRQLVVALGEPSQRNRAWVRMNNGSWNASPSDDPAMATCDINISTYGTVYGLAEVWNNPGDTITPILAHRRSRSRRRAGSVGLEKTGISRE